MSVVVRSIKHLYSHLLSRGNPAVHLSDLSSPIRTSDHVRFLASLYVLLFFVFPLSEIFPYLFVGYFNSWPGALMWLYWSSLASLLLSPDTHDGKSKTTQQHVLWREFSVCCSIRILNLTLWSCSVKLWNLSCFWILWSLPRMSKWQAASSRLFCMQLCSRFRHLQTTRGYWSSKPFGKGRLILCTFLKYYVRVGFPQLWTPLAKPPSQPAH